MARLEADLGRFEVELRVVRAEGLRER